MNFDLNTLCYTSNPTNRHSEKSVSKLALFQPLGHYLMSQICFPHLIVYVRDSDFSAFSVEWSRPTVHEHSDSLIFFLRLFAEKFSHNPQSKLVGRETVQI